MIFPWQTQQWQQLCRAKDENRLPHALLFAGVPGVGKMQFADTFTRALLCQQASACGVCHSCSLIANKSHPNVMWVEPEKAGQAIKIDQIRDVSDFVAQSSIQGGYRVVIIHPANQMNANAANALLKTLEEPAAGALLILISDQSGQLPATVLSRCQLISFSRPDTQTAFTWLQSKIEDKNIDASLLLQIAQGAPLAALNLLQDDMLNIRQNLFSILYSLSMKKVDPITSASTLQDNNPLIVLDFFITWIMDLLKLHLNASENITNRDYAGQLTELKSILNLNNAAKLMAYLQQIRGQLSEGINFNKQLMLESMLIRWSLLGS